MTLTRPELIQKYDLERLMDCDGITSISLDVIRYDVLKAGLSAMEAQRSIYELFRTIFQIQFEARGLIIDFGLIQDLSSTCMNELFAKNNWNHFKFSTGTKSWIDKVLRNWTCQHCETRVYGEAHSMIECRQVLIDSVLSS